MVGDRAFDRKGGYLGIALLAAMITLGVMLVFFTEGQASPMLIEVGDELSQPCDSTADGSDACYAVVVENVSDGEVSGSVACSVTNPKDGFATFVNGKHTYDSEPIPPGETATLIIRVDLISGVPETDPPAVDCAPA